MENRMGPLSPVQNYDSEPCWACGTQAPFPPANDAPVVRQRTRIGRGLVKRTKTAEKVGLVAMRCFIIALRTFTNCLLYVLDYSFVIKQIYFIPSKSKTTLSEKGSAL